MKLLTLPAFYPPHTGGVETYAQELNQNLLKDRAVDSITVFTSRIPVNQPIKEINDKVTIIRYPAIEIVHNYPIPKIWTKEFRQLYKEILKDNYGIVISHTRFFNASLLALKISRKKKIKLIHIEHGSDFVQSNNPIISNVARIYDQTFGKKVIKTADQVVAISQAVANFIQTNFNRKTRVIYRGIETDLIDQTPINEIAQKKYANKTIITYFGRLISGKGVIDLIEAFSQLKQSQTVLFIIGDGDQRKELEELVKQKNLAKRIVFWGNLPPEKAIGLVKSSNIVVNPSYTEGLPTTVIEASLCAKAIIATSVGGTNEIIKNNESSLLVKPHNPDELTTALNKLLNNPKLAKEFGQKAQVVSREKFNWNNNIKDFTKLISEQNSIK